MVSHSSATPLNQQIYAEIGRQTGWQTTLVVPADWRDEFGNRLKTTRWPTFGGHIESVPVWVNGSIVFHVYRHRWSRYLAREKFDAIYMNHEPYALATAQLAWANARGPKVPMGFYSCQNIAKRYPPPFRWLENMVYRHSRFAFPITENVATVLRGKGFSGEITVCPLPLDPAIYRPYPVNEWPALLHRDDKTVMLGFVGRVIEAKGLRTLALALRELRDLDWKFLLVGLGPFLDEFKALLTEGGVEERLLHVGFIPHEETPKYLAGLDILVLPSETQPNWKEQFGRVIPEALACGACVVGSDSGEIPNLIHASGGGLVFPERNAHALAVSLRHFILNPEQRRSAAARGRQWVIDHISLERVASCMVKTIRCAVGRE